VPGPPKLNQPADKPLWFQRSALGRLILSRLKNRQFSLSHASAFLILLGFAATGCSSSSGGSGGGGASSKPLPTYCPYLPSKAFSPAWTIQGKAYYEFRVMGDGEVSDSKRTITVAAGIAGDAYTLSVNGTSHTYTCAGTLGSNCATATAAASWMATNINADYSGIAAATASGANIVVSPVTEGDALTTTLTTGNFTYPTLSPSAALNPNPHKDPNPIRFAEVSVTDSAGNVVQCAETDSAGAFSFQLPRDSSTYTIRVLSGSNNSSNTAYVMTNPTANDLYSISTTVVASANSSNTRLVAKATGSLEGGAFNILDQISNAQSYLRTQTANCSSSGQTNYVPDCDPVTDIPMISVYWTPGLTPAVYRGGTGPISYYLNGQRTLWIQGGLNGDTDNTDMDQFDNSVIIHEYGHFIEDMFGRPDSPGGSHNGNAVIDARLAWGEGWADFFQAAVTGNPYYRDTFGHIGCSGTPPSGQSSCYGASFNENVDTSPTLDIPTATGEGNFREFSVTRLLYAVVKPGGTKNFSEIWTALHGPTSGMKAVADRFKSIGRLHKIQLATAGHSDWSSYRTTEKQTGDLSGYGTPFNSSCASTSQAMAVRMTAADNASFAKSDQFRNNDFYTYAHPGGTFNLQLSWSGANQVDLDVYIYKEGYAYGDSSSMAASSAVNNFGTSGTESISTSLPAGNYMINVMAFTGNYAASTATYNTTYNLTLNGAPVCPTP
jgi:hypothetical protein